MEFLVPALEVKIECYEGPLAVLINLIKKNRVSVWDIPLAPITERFLQYVELVQEMRLKIAEDFIEVASLLIYIKSKMLLPKAIPEDETDPRDELIERIIEYERLKNMVDAINNLPLLNRDIFAREGSSIQGKDDYNLLSLCNAFFDLIRNKEDRYIVVRELKPTLEEKLSMLKDILDSKGFFEWGDGDEMEHSEKVVTILGMLELTKINMATIHQRRPFSRIIIKRRDGGI
ncbi:MAG: segregation/condensation protein A [Syntrophorhabdaceae bacterium]|nr:segregation/condensation protein A [Syntrophorhabdaceae bacterium]